MNFELITKFGTPSCCRVEDHLGGFLEVPCEEYELNTSGQALQYEREEGQYTGHTATEHGNAHSVMSTHVEQYWNNWWVKLLPTDQSDDKNQGQQ